MVTDILPSQRFSVEQTRSIIEEFFREGSVLVPNVLTPDEVTALRERTDYFTHRDTLPQRHVRFIYDTFVLWHCHDLDPLFGAMITREPIFSLAAVVLDPEPYFNAEKGCPDEDARQGQALGTELRFNALNVIRNEPGQAITLWHVDNVLEFPLPPDIPRLDARIRMPVHWFTVHVALSDIDSLEHGPTQYVPGSHYSGRHPVSQDEPTFEGRGPVSIFCKAGDIFFTNHQTWHRGAPNTSDRVRYLMQIQYAQRWAEERFRGEIY